MGFVEHSHHVHVESYSYDFRYKHSPRSGFGFPCDKDGNIKLDELPEPARESLEMCLRGENNLIPVGVVNGSYRYLQHARYKCQCGEIIELIDPLTNTCKCKREYNMGGQLLAPPEQREEVWDADRPELPWGVYGDDFE